MKKAAVITLHYIRNYGSVLQTFATQYMFEKLGYSVEIIDYIRPNMRNDGRKKAGGNILRNVVYTVENWFINRVCTAFLQKYVHLTRNYEDYQALAAEPPGADVYITGSDQTWNSEYNGGVLPAYYLDFAPGGCKRIGYSVSIGMNNFPDEEKAQIKSYIEKYDAVSVRDKRAKYLLKDLGYQNVEQVIDPTLALSREDWCPLFSKKMIRGKYILIYKLNRNPLLEEYAKKLAKETGCKIVRVTYWLSNLFHGGKGIFCPNVGAFLSLIDNAEYVLTDSFHCTAFSLNFHKNIYVFYPGKYSSRLQSVLELTGTEHRVIRDTAERPDEIDFSHVDDVLLRERSRIVAFMKENC